MKKIIISLLLFSSFKNTLSNEIVVSLIDKKSKQKKDYLLTQQSVEFSQLLKNLLEHSIFEERKYKTIIHKKFKDIPHSIYDYFFNIFLNNDLKEIFIKQKSKDALITYLRTFNKMKTTAEKKSILKLIDFFDISFPQNIQVSSPNEFIKTRILDNFLHAWVTITITDAIVKIIISRTKINEQNILIQLNNQADFLTKKFDPTMLNNLELITIGLILDGFTRDKKLSQDELGDLSYYFNHLTPNIKTVLETFMKK